MKINYEQLIDPPITKSELVPVELSHEPEKTEETYSLTPEQERAIDSKSAEELRGILRMLYENPDIDPSAFFEIRKAVQRALILLKNPNMADLNARQKKGQPNVQYDKDAEVYEFPAQPKQTPNKKRSAVQPKTRRKLPSYLKIIK